MFLHSQIHVFGLLEANPTILLLCDLALLCTHPSAAVGFLRVILCPAGWGYTNLTPYPSLMGWKVVVFRKINSLPLYHCNMFTYQDETHTCLTRNQNTCFSLMGGWGGRWGKDPNLTFHLLVPGSTSTSAATTVRGGRVTDGSQPRDRRTGKEHQVLWVFLVSLN